MSDDGFRGFSKETFRFLKNLKKNNNKEWFDENRDVYEEYVLTPARYFVVELGARLKTLSPGLTAIPEVDKSIFRLRRDTRFSEDKTPYKTHLGILFWEGPGKKLDNPNYYVHLNEDSIFIGAGEYRFPPGSIKAYRDSVVHPKRGAELGRILKGICLNPSYKIGGRHYKRISSGYDPAHRNSELLLHNGLYTYYEGPVPEDAYSGRFVDFCFRMLRDMSPLFRWTLEVLGSGGVKGGAPTSKRGF